MFSGKFVPLLNFWLRVTAAFRRSALSRLVILYVSRPYSAKLGLFVTIVASLNEQIAQLPATHARHEAVMEITDVLQTSDLQHEKYGSELASLPSRGVADRRKGMARSSGHLVPAHTHSHSHSYSV